jgi:enamine deaminase RidA (YjgF/YER057c/UK114 family)
MRTEIDGGGQEHAEIGALTTVNHSEIVLQNIETAMQEMAKGMARLTSQTMLLDAALAVLKRHDLLGEFSAELSVPERQRTKLHEEIEMAR